MLATAPGSGARSGCRGPRPWSRAISRGRRRPSTPSTGRCRASLRPSSLWPSRASAAASRKHSRRPSTPSARPRTPPTSRRARSDCRASGGSAGTSAGRGRRSRPVSQTARGYTESRVLRAELLLGPDASLDDLARALDALAAANLDAERYNPVRGRRPQSRAAQGARPAGDSGVPDRGRARDRAERPAATGGGVPRPRGPRDRSLRAPCAHRPSQRDEKMEPAVSPDVGSTPRGALPERGAGPDAEGFDDVAAPEAVRPEPSLRCAGAGAAWAPRGTARSAGRRPRASATTWSRSRRPGSAGCATRASGTHATRTPSRSPPARCPARAPWRSCATGCRRRTTPTSRRWRPRGRRSPC